MYLCRWMESKTTRHVTGVLLLPFVVQAHDMELVTNHVSNVQDSMDRLIDKLLSNLASKFFDRALKASSLHDADLDNMTLGMPGHLAITRHRSPLFRASRLFP